MNKWSKEEVNLCKQIAQKHKRFPRKGDWEYNDNTKEATLRKNEYSGMENPLSDEVNIFLIWTISDCLEWLDERYDDINIAKFRNEEWELEIQDAFDKIHHVNHIIKLGKTPLETCLKAVLAVLEKE